MIRHITAAAVALTVALPAGASTLTDTYSSFYILGDSLSDTGKASRATDDLGPLWNEPVAAEFTEAGLDTQNFAYGGATIAGDSSFVPDLQTQVDFLLQTSEQDREDSLVALFIGGNDVPDILASEDPFAQLAATVEIIDTAINTILSEGFGTIALFEVPNVGVTPLATALGIGGGATFFSAELNKVYAGFAAALPDQIALVELFEFATALDTNPTDFGFEAAVPCVGFLAPENGPSCADTVYWDEFHPTSAVHALVEDAFREALHPVPVPLPAALLLTGLGGLLLTRKRAA